MQDKLIEISKTLNRAPGEIKLLFAASTLWMLMSKGLAFVPALGLDDYVTMHQAREPASYLSQGRFTQAFIQLIMSAIEISTTEISWVSTTIFILFFSWSITLGILLISRERGSIYGLIATSAIMATHPYLTEYFSFRESLITQAIAFVLMAAILTSLSVIPAGETKFPANKKLTLIALMVSLAGTQQTTFFVLGMFLIAIPTQLYINSGNKRPTGHAGIFFTPALKYYVTSGAIYTLIWLLISTKLTGPVDARGSLIHLEQLPKRLTLVATLLEKIFVHEEPLVSLGIKQTLALTFLVALISAFSSRMTRLFFLIPFSVVLCAMSVLLVTISSVWWPVPRSIFAISFAIAIIFLLLYLAPSKFSSKYYCVFATISAFGLACHSNQLLYDQIRLNRWDFWTAQEIAHQIISIQPHEGTEVTLVGSRWWHPLGLRTIDGDLNTSALSVSWAAKDLFEEATGRKWRVKTLENSARCAEAPVWPEKGAITLQSDGIYVCMGK